MLKPSYLGPQGAAGGTGVGGACQPRAGRVRGTPAQRGQACMPPGRHTCAHVHTPTRRHTGGSLTTSLPGNPFVMQMTPPGGPASLQRRFQSCHLSKVRPGLKVGALQGPVGSCSPLPTTGSS